MNHVESSPIKPNQTLFGDGLCFSAPLFVADVLLFFFRMTAREQNECVRHRFVLEEFRSNRTISGFLRLGYNLRVSCESLRTFRFEFAHDGSIPPIPSFHIDDNNRDIHHELCILAGLCGDAATGRWWQWQCHELWSSSASASAVIVVATKRFFFVFFVVHSCFLLSRAGTLTTRCGGCFVS